MILRSQPLSEGNDTDPPSQERTYLEAIRLALQEEMRTEPRVFIIGDLGLDGGNFGMTRELLEEFGPERIRDVPLSESAIAGCAIGAALTGMLPVAELQLGDFMSLAVDQMINQGAKLCFLFGEDRAIPVVFRAPLEASGGLTAQHLQYLEKWLTYVPDLRVVLPATPADAKGLLSTAIHDPHPVIFLEHIMLYGQKGQVPSGNWRVPFGRAAVRRVGKDLTIIAISIMVERALAVARRLANEGIEAEVIDPRTLRPLDEETLIASVSKTKRVLIAHEAVQLGGFGGEIAAKVAASQGFSHLEAPIMQLGEIEMFLPSATKQATLEEDDLYRAVHCLMQYCY